MERAGTQTLLMGVYRNLDRTKVQFDFVVHTEQPSDFDDEIAHLGGRIFRVPSPRVVGPVRFATGVDAILRRPDGFAGMHAHLYLFSGYLLWLAHRAGVRMRISHSHTAPETKGMAVHRAIYGRFMRRLIRTHATHILACSHLAAGSLFGPDYAGDPRFRLLPNAIDLEPFRAQDDDLAALRAKLGLPERATIVGHVGRFIPTKNHKFLVDVFGLLHARLPDAHLLLVGDGPLRTDVQRQVHQLGLSDRVYFCGVRSDVPQLVAALDLVLFPSLYEGLGIVTIEAQAAGTPCLASHATPDEADTGLGLLQRLDLPAGADAWATKALEMLKYDRPAWSVRERALLAAGFDVRETARRLQGIYCGEET